MRIMSQDNNSIRIKMSHEEWSFLFGGLMAADFEGWPYRDDLFGGYQNQRKLYDEISCIDGEIK